MLSGYYHLIVANSYFFPRVMHFSAFISFCSQLLSDIKVHIPTNGNLKKMEYLYLLVFLGNLFISLPLLCRVL